MHMPGVEPIAVVNTGKPLDLDRIVAAEQAREQIEGQKKKLARTRRRNSTASPAYAAAALTSAAEIVASAPSGERHDTLFREAASVARSELGLDEDAILAALLSAAASADADDPEHEHERVIRDAIRKERSS
jgi:hypothetical protein